MTGGVLARVNVVLSFAGLFIALMLSLSHLMHIELPCGVDRGCDLVTQDSRSQLLGIPFAFYGLFGYTVIATISLIRLFSPTYKSKAMHGLGYALSLIGLMVSIGLTVFSVKSIHALCTWCLASAVTMSLLFVSHSLGAVRDLEHKKPRFADAVWVYLLFSILGAATTSAAFDLRAEAKTVRVDRVALRELNEAELLPADAHVTGPESAKATVVMFGDLTCPVCREAYEFVRKVMSRRHDFRFAFRQLPLSFHPLARPAALISEMAAEKGRFWEYLDACYTDYPESEANLVSMGVEVGLDKKLVEKRMADPNDAAALALERDDQVVRKLGLHTTPSVFILIDGYYPEPITYRGIETMLDNNTAVKR